jgi:signal transduction histidine kinase
LSDDLREHAVPSDPWLRAVERDLAEQRLLADISATLGASLDYRVTVARAVARAVPFLADVCVVEALDTRNGAGATERLGAAFAGPDDHVLAEEVVRVARREGCDERTVLVRGATGSARLASLVGVPLVSQGVAMGFVVLGAADPRRRYDEAHVALAEEIARRVSLAIANARLHEKAELANRRRQDVLAMVSHDLRSPLNAILFVAQSMMRTPEDEDRRKGDRHKAEIVRRCAERMDRMIQDLLDMSSIEAGHLSVDVRSTALASVLKEAVEASLDAADAKHQRLEVRLPPDSLVVACDGHRIIQVVANLLSNAIKFTPAGGSITVTAEQGPEGAVVRVTDTGPGIPESIVPHLFQRYWRAPHTASRGTGLGLFIAKGIIEAHGGSIGVEPRPGLGATFYFTLRVVAREGFEPSTYGL